MTMKRILLTSLFAFFFVCSASLAQALELTRIGTTDLTGQGIGSTVSAYTYDLRSFSLYGKTVEASKSVSVKIDDVTYSATSNASGEWSTYLSNLTYDTHQVTVSASGETSLNFNLTISSASATTTPTPTPTTTATTSTTTKGGDTLPEAGVLDNTFFLSALAMLTFGVGLSWRYYRS